MKISVVKLCIKISCALLLAVTLWHAQAEFTPSPAVTGGSFADAATAGFSPDATGAENTKALQRGSDRLEIGDRRHPVGCVFKAGDRAEAYAAGVRQLLPRLPLGVSPTACSLATTGEGRPDILCAYLSLAVLVGLLGATALPACNSSCATYVVAVTVEDEATGALLCDARVTFGAGDGGVVVDASTASTDAEVAATSSACRRSSERRRRR